ncbi:serine protease, S1-C subfamily, contains C-terminal PDZ domain [Paenibacillus sp. 1_12]|uniref:S1C family serine protease n=1 Tax=Paenibacillus sp. 1_12 TaxID=1566278 RepID=UPI0008EF80C9|nr:trypsin-like peptidase domain-containing protein [Paenibacillus sp. 1_12]SFL77545.1 serine protease, S1-C subfamily, contains C-terminal PDZ domain [Paenibacillus sp. 1_12]
MENNHKDTRTNIQPSNDHENRNDQETLLYNEQSDDYRVTQPRLFGEPRSKDKHSSEPNWQENNKYRSSKKSVFAAFMAGVLVVGGMMFASDRMNMFTGGTLASPPSVSAAASKAVSNGTAQKASLDITRPNNIADIAQQASSAVVKIETKVKAQSSKNQNNPLYSDPFFRQFFGDNNGGNQEQDQNGQLQPSGLGTGFIFESSGYIITNEHVIDGADEINVTIEGQDKPYKAKLLGNSYDLDLAVLKIEGSTPFSTLPIGNSDDSRVGDWVVAIGNPYDFDYTVTAGLLSAKERPISIPDENGTREYKHLLQTDAAINPGNSGGPLLNMDGEVIGINTAVNSQAQGIGFAIPSSTISSVLQQLKDNVTIPKEPVPFIGVSVQDLTSDMLSELKVDTTDGALVADVQRKSPAFEAGIRPYDVIVAVNGAKITTSTELTTKVQALKTGDKATVTIMSNGVKKDLTVTVGDKTTINSTQKQNQG